MKKELQPCGTPAAYGRHKRRGEEACEECLAAISAYNKAYRASHPKVAEQNRKSNAVTRESVKQLISRNLREYLEIRTVVHREMS